MPSSHSDKLSVAVIGARTHHQGTGPWLARFFHKYGAEIIGILGTSAESAKNATDELKNRFEIITKPFFRWEDLLAADLPDLLVIASPSHTHRHYLQLALTADIPVFCEKPFIWENGRDNLADTQELINRFRAQKLPLFINTQLTETIGDFKRIYPHCDLQTIHSFEMEMSPASSGKNMLPDSMPHVWSILTAIAGPGKLADFKISFPNPGRCDMRGTYNYARGSCDLKVTLQRHAQQPRPLAYAINHCRVERIIDPADYSMSFKAATGTYPIGDPLEKKVKRILQNLTNAARGQDIHQQSLVTITLEMELLAATLEGCTL